VVDNRDNDFGLTSEVSTLRAAEPTLAAALPDDMVYFPEVIQTTEDSPVLLSRLIDIADEAGGDSGISIVAINGVDIVSGRGAQLPGIRVGEGEGAGYVFRRDLDGQLVFSPDVGFAGLTAFTYTIADVFGGSATLVAALRVSSGEEDDAAITFADGSQTATVAEGIDAAIIGALSFDGLDKADEAITISVFEGDSEEPSQRFLVAGDKLQLSGGVDRASEDTIPLRIVASVDGFEIAAGEFEIEVRSFGASAMQSPVAFPFPPNGRLVLAYSADSQLTARSVADQMMFDALIAEAGDSSLTDEDMPDPFVVDGSADGHMGSANEVMQGGDDGALGSDINADPSLLPTRTSDISDF
jgi:hypothetical protein